MSVGEFMIQPLGCGNCGKELPVMGRFVSFQCETCFSYWIVSSRGLTRLIPYRAQPPEGYEGDPVYLPFWVIGIDGGRLRESVSRIMTGLKTVMQEITVTGSRQPVVETEEILITQSTFGMQQQSVHRLTGTDFATSLPSSGEIGHMLDRIESAGDYYVYVPAFDTANTHLQLKAGRLMTLRQPAYRAARIDMPRQHIRCIMGPDEALALIDYIFISTLPESIRTCSGLIGELHLEHSAAPVMVEFPFAEHGTSLESLIGSFHI
jgi:hypothetical protein